MAAAPATAERLVGLVRGLHRARQAAAGRWLLWSGPGSDAGPMHGTGLTYPLANWFNANFTLHANSMDLSLFANNGQSEMRMQANTITRFGSDAPYFGFACFYSGCSGAEGQWVMVPEPGTSGLLGIGVLDLLLKRRRNEQRAL